MILKQMMAALPDEDDDQISADQQKAGTLIWPHQVKYFRFQDEYDCDDVAIDGYR